MRQLGGSLRCTSTKDIPYETVTTTSGSTPYSLERPLVFHVLTGMPNAVLEELQTANAVLAPQAIYRRHPMNRRGWKQQQPTMLFGRDKAAGDDEYIFFSIGRPFDGSTHRAAVAFDLVELAKARGIHFRPHDLESAYNVVANLGSESYEASPDEELPEDLDPRAMNMASELQDIASCGTESDRGKALLLARLHLRNVVERRDGRVEAARILESKLSRCRPCEDEDFCEPTDAGLRLIDWISPFKLREWAIFREGPEILYPGALPLRCAAFCRDKTTDWQWKQGSSGARLQGLGELLVNGPMIPAFPQRRGL